MKGCVLIPYRNREEHLKTFLSDADVELDIIVIEQADEKLFNRAKLLNIGFSQAKDSYDYFIFHDVDMIPFGNIDYSYCENICHLARKVEQFEYKMPYAQYFGGVTLFPKDKFILVNGFSNEYWGWGQEDDNLYFRCKKKNLNVEFRDIYYRSLRHESNMNIHTFRKNSQLSVDFERNPEMIESDGLNSLRYELVSQETFKTHTHIKTIL
jgi:hypothetical protein